MNIKQYKVGTFLFLLTFSTPALFAANESTNSVNPTSQLINVESTAVPAVEQNDLQETPEYVEALNTDLEIEEELSVQEEQQTESENQPYQVSFTNSAWEQYDVADEFYDSPYQVSLFSPKNGEDSDRLVSQTGSIFYYGLGAISVLAVLPDSVTNWESSGDQSLPSKWVENVKEGPVWDRDDVVLNYIMHPYFGGAYYQTARKSGYRQWDSFLYSTLMSTVFWEYGVEAFAETPSMQDLVVTPVLGWVYGEWAFNKEREIWSNGGTVWGREDLGNLALFLLDPIDSVGRNVNRLFGRDVIKAGTGYVKISEQSSAARIPNDKQIMFEVNYIFGDEDNAAQSGISGKRKRNSGYSFANTKDPVNTGIIGISLGGGHVIFDNKRGLKSQEYGQVSLGLYFTPSFSARLNYNSTKMLQTFADRDYDYETFSVDGQYYFNTESPFRPFVTAGIGEEIWDQDKSLYNFQVNAGIGFHYKLNNKWALQVDATNYFTTDESSHDQQISGKVIYRFGEGEGNVL
ncbi:DUF3943 domain-containing protein [Psychromonas aquatilis]|uniref:DUF3943 domain-containing protein n=1 Tax=Psychromonas aquatilis TaxID=2005072 RepID=A0ABU9GU59_9GAMM